MNESTRVTHNENGIELCFGNNIVLVFPCRDGEVLGVSDMTCNGVPLRNSDVLWKPLLNTPEGIHYHRFELEDVRENDDGAVDVICKIHGLRTGIADIQDEYLLEIVDIPCDSEPIVDRLVWSFKPEQLQLGNHAFEGISYHYRFESQTRQVFHVFDYQSWEIGGHVEDNTLLFQGQINPPVTELKKEVYFTTACNYYGAELKGALGKPDKISMQRLPRIATIQSFDFLTHPQGVLFNYFEPCVDVLTIVHKESGEDRLHIVDEFRQPLAKVWQSPDKRVLFSPLAAELSRPEQRNLWREAYDFVHDRERERVEIEASHVLPRVWTPQIAGDTFTYEGDTVPREEALILLGDKVVPKWAAMGVKQICIPSIWVSDYTVDRFRCKNETGLQGGFTVSGICCVREHSIDPLFGGLDALAYFVNKVHEYNMEVQMWWATHLSRRAPIFEEHPEFMVKSRDGNAGCGGIGKDVIIPMDLTNPACFDWEFSKLKAVYDATGIDGFFNDSYGNYTFLPVNYQDPERTCQQQAYARFVSKLQQTGMKSFTIEGIGPWGIGHFGMSLIKGKQSRGYQNALDWWLGNEDMIYRLNMGIHAPIWDEVEDAKQFAFRCMAFGGRFGFTQYDEHHVEQWSGWWQELNRLHAQFVPLTGRREILANDQGVLWELEPGRRILFTFGKTAFKTDQRTEVCRISADGLVPVTHEDGVLNADAWSVYRLAD